MKSSKGLTLLEVLAAISLLGVVITLFGTSSISSMRTTREMGFRTDGNTVLSYFGRMASGGAGRTLPFDPASGKLVYEYGNLEAAYPELASSDANVKDANQYKVTVTSPGTIVIGDSTLYQFSVQVCWNDQSRESCIDGLTAGPLGVPTGGGAN